MLGSLVNDESTRSHFDVTRKFNGNDMDMFLCLFECVADARCKMPDAERTLMLQCILQGEAQEACFAAFRGL